MVLLQKSYQLALHRRFRRRRLSGKGPCQAREQDDYEERRHDHESVPASFLVAILMGNETGCACFSIQNSNSLLMFSIHIFNKNSACLAPHVPSCC